MHEIKCPKCGEVFQVDESGYAELLGQVRNEAFEEELHKRAKELEAKEQMGRIWNLEVKERETTLEVEVVEDKTMFQRKIICKK